jgi:RNA polymerase sigma-70 factor (ECF subfamily)
MKAAILDEGFVWPSRNTRAEHGIHGRTSLGGKMLDGETDEALMARTAAGDHRAFRALMGRHIRRAVRLAQATLGHAGDADEVAQEAFVRVWRRASSFDPKLARFTTWLHQIVVNLCIDRKRRPRGEPLEVAGDVPDGAPDALDHVMDGERQRLMQVALASLPERQRAAIALFHFEGLSGRDGASALDMSEKAFESLLIRARTALKERVRAATAGRPRENASEP